MAYLENAWYALGWSEDIGREPVSRTVLNQQIAFYRKQEGGVAALADRCPHRFAPLSRGRLKGDVLECGYHGLQFGTNGRCVFNPHGDGSIPKNANVRAYPVVERHSMAFIWMGAAELADEATLPDFSPFDADGEFVSVFGTLHVKANYQLITDNLLDLTHGQYLHPLFTNPAGPATMLPTGDDDDMRTVWAKFYRPGQYPNGYFQMLGYPAGQLGDHRNFMRWTVPGHLLLDVGMTGVGRPAEEGLAIPTAHFLTPDTEFTTHYFWGMARNFRKDDPALSDQLLRVGIDIFDNEDKPLIEAQQKVIGPHEELLRLRPAFLPTDGPAIRARRTLGELIRQENFAKRADPQQPGRGKET